MIGHDKSTGSRRWQQSRRSPRSSAMKKMMKTEKKTEKISAGRPTKWPATRNRCVDVVPRQFAAKRLANWLAGFDDLLAIRVTNSPGQPSLRLSGRLACWLARWKMLPAAGQADLDHRSIAQADKRARPHATTRPRGKQNIALCLRQRLRRQYRRRCSKSSERPI